MIEKPKRTKNKKNLALIRSLDCFVCGARPVDVDHIKTVKSGGGDDLSNLQALCRRCHISKHTMGVKTFFTTYKTRLQESREKYDLPPVSMLAIREIWD